MDPQLKKNLLLICLIAVGAYLFINMGFDFGTWGQQDQFTGSIYIENLDGSLTAVSMNGVTPLVLFNGQEWNYGKIIIVPTATILGQVNIPATTAANKTITVKMSSVASIKSADIGGTDIKQYFNLWQPYVQAPACVAETWGVKSLTLGINCPTSGSFQTQFDFVGNTLAYSSSGVQMAARWGVYEVSHSEIAHLFPAANEQKEMTVVLSGTFDLYIDGSKVATKEGTLTLKATLSNPSFTGSITIVAWTASAQITTY